MYETKKRILWFAVVTRVIILFLQFIFNILCPDHNADAFKGFPDPTVKISVWDDFVNYFFSGLTRWDGQYFLHIAKYGYTYENNLAFYPLYPMSIWVVATILKKIFFLLNFDSNVIIAAVLISFICFIKSVAVFYELSVRVLKDTNAAYKSAVLYCINPASIFFSGTYSESMFAYFTFFSMLGSIKNNPYTCFPVGLSTLIRSNGVINIGFPIYFAIKNTCSVLLLKVDFDRKTVWNFMWKMFNIKNCFLLFNTIIISLTPLLLLQIYNYTTFCIFNPDNVIPSHIVQYGMEKNLILANNENASWCKNQLPFAYSYVQNTYWNVGFMKYYKFIQIPNFILAFPILYIMVLCIKEFCIEYRHDLYLLGLFTNTKDEYDTKVKKYPFEMYAYVVHGLFLTLFCIFFVHIQVSTRLLCSASPLMYWYCALSMSYKPRDNLYESNCDSKWKVFFLSQKTYTLQDKLIISYFLGYSIIGCFMFSNFLPWT